MGLDMYLYKKVYLGLSYDHNREQGKETKIVINGVEHSSENLDELTYKAGYWRKANHIHKWFVENVQDGEDDCKEYYVSIDQLISLYNLCEEVLANKEVAEEVLPTQEGFFFGGTEYDEYYMQDVEYTMNLLKPIIESGDADKVSYYYSSSW